MIEHEAGLGTVVHEIDDVAQLIMRRTQIEHQSTSPHGAHAIHERALAAEPGGLSLDILPDGFDPGQRRERIQRLCESRAPSPEPLCEIDEGDDCGDARVALRQPFHELDLPPGLSRPAIRFHEHHAADRDLPRGRRIVPREKRPMEGRHAFEPGVVQLGGIPEMDVGIDYPHRPTPGRFRIADFGLRIRCPPFHSAIHNPQSAIMLPPIPPAPDPVPRPAR